MSESPRPSPSGDRQRIDVVNGPREVVVSIATDLAAWEWTVPAGARFILLDEPLARPGGIEILDHSSQGKMCQVLDTSNFTAASFTIVLTGPAVGGPYTMTLHYGSPDSNGAASTDYTSDCSG